MQCEPSKACGATGCSPPRLWPISWRAAFELQKPSPLPQDQTLLAEHGPSGSSGIDIELHIPSTGGPQIQTLLDGLGGWALFASLAGLLISAIAWALGSFGGNYNAVSRGKTGVVVCAGFCELNEDGRGD